MTKLRYAELLAGIFFLICVGSTIVAAYLLATAVFFDSLWSNFFWAFGTAIAAQTLVRLCRSYRQRRVLEAKLARVFREN